MRRMAFYAFLSLLGTSGAALGDGSPTHCAAGETTYFNCVADVGVASLCGKDDESGRYLQYRFGPGGGAPEQLIPNGLEDSDMGRTFHYSYVENEEAMFGRTRVWLRTADRTYQLTYISRLDHEGRLMPRESAVLIWEGLPAGAPNAMKCSEATAGLALEFAEPLIKRLAGPEHRWWEQP